MPIQYLHNILLGTAILLAIGVVIWVLLHTIILVVTGKKRRSEHVLGGDFGFYADIFEAESIAENDKNIVLRKIYKLYKKIKRFTTFCLLFFVFIIICEFFYGIYFLISSGGY